jgi:hypothetical protein
MEMAELPYSVEGDDIAGNSIANYRTADNGTTVPQANGTLNIDLPDLSTPTTAEVSEDSAALTGNAMMSSYITSGQYTTDWIITYPTRYTKVSDNALEPARAPFDTPESPVHGLAWHSKLRIAFTNREDQHFETIIDIFPPPSMSRYAVNVFAMNSDSDYSETISSKAVKLDAELRSEFLDGWVILDMSYYSVTPAVGSVPEVVTGFPVLGFTAVADTVSGSERGGVFASRIMVDKQ